ncbi:MAG: alpha/beta hydrolase [Bacteroidetes bacterium]|nr:alpha/beta hydrolase [Bacteroidota bacterium]
MNKENNYISVRGINLYYEIINAELINSDKPLLVFLHEGLGCVQQWKDFPLLLSEKVNYPVLLYDREGHGKSEMLKSLRSTNFIHEQAQIVLPELFEKLNLTDCNKILIGHSDGGSIAIIHAGTYPQKIKAVITEAAHVFIEEITLSGLKDAVESYQNGRLKELLYKYHGENTDTMFHGWSDTWLKDDFLNWNIEDYLKNISCNFLAIQGENDQYGTIAQLESIKNNTKGNTELFLVPACGHIPHLQSREAVLKHIADFIKK